jgi:DnaJ like chaperone protein
MALTKYGKWILGGLGWTFGGPIGAIIGFLMGSAFEGMDSGEFEYGKPETTTQSGDFRISMLILSASVMKADGKQLKSELDYVKAFFVQNFGVTATQYYMRAFRDILKQEIPLQDVCMQIRANMDINSRLQLIHYLFGIAMADGNTHPNEVKVIEDIANWINIPPQDFISLKNMFVKDTNSAYKILEINPEANEDEIKKAFRAMAFKYHPDRVAHLGEEFQLAAKEKFQKVNDAYNTIKKERGF